MSKMFRTDGIRGRANTAPITPDVMLLVGMAAGIHLSKGVPGGKVLIAKDTRQSGYMIESALTAGLTAVGLSPVLVGPLPTPAVSMLTRSMRAAFGIMITASHNPFHDNGIKLFGPDGYKICKDDVNVIEKLIQSPLTEHLSCPSTLGRAMRLEDARGRYVEWVKQSFPRDLRLDGLKIVVDCANGAGYRVAPEVLYELGAEVIAIGTSPNGININDGYGATCPQRLRSEVILNGADIGIALDGDGDRLVVSDENGGLVDGDQIMALIADRWHKNGRLKGNGIAATIMSNMGLERFLTSKGLNLTRTPVGDSHVVEAMRNNDLNVGGEVSGHLIFGQNATTGDGLSAALHLLAELVREQRPASEMCQVFSPFPQVLHNLPFEGKSPLSNTKLKKQLGELEKTIGTTGRLLIRESGTEPLIRVMVEGDDIGAVNTYVRQATDLITTVGHA